MDKNEIYITSARSDIGNGSYTVTCSDNGLFSINNTISDDGKLYFSYDLNGYNVLSGYSTRCKLILTDRTISKKLVPTTEERIEEYITDNYDKYDIEEYGSHIYQMIQEKAYDFAFEVVEEAKEEYEMLYNEEKIIETIIEEINFNSLYDLIEDIVNAPITMEDKLSEVGMSIRDFL